MSTRNAYRAAALAVAAFTATAAQADGPVLDLGKARILPERQIQLPPERIRPVIVCTDPAAVEIRVSNVRTRPDGAATIYDFDVVGTVRNIGITPWSSGRNQQSANLAFGGRVVAWRDFTALAVGASVSLRSRMSLYASDEFPPSVELSITYDPDIAIDGNRGNDDCRLGNNTRRLSGSELLGLAAGS